MATGIVSGGQVMKLGSTGNLQISGGLTTGGATQMNGNLAVTGTTNFDTVLPTSTLVPSTGNQLTNKTYVDTKTTIIILGLARSTSVILTQCFAMPYKR